MAVSGDRHALDVGSLIAERRKRAKLTQAELAALANVSRSFVNTLEKGHPRAELAKTLAVLDALDIEVGPALKTRSRRLPSVREFADWTPGKYPRTTKTPT